MVPEVGLEPTRLSAGDFESPASTCFTTRAWDEFYRECVGMSTSAAVYFLLN